MVTGWLCVSTEKSVTEGSKLSKQSDVDAKRNFVAAQMELVRLNGAC